MTARPLHNRKDSMPKIKLDPADIAFSKYIRTRDGWRCQRCHTRYIPPTKALHNSHYFGRARENTRFDPENCDSLCYGCHKFWGSDDKEGYRQFKIKQLGQKRFDLLTLRASTYCKKDRKMALIKSRLLLKELETE